MSHPERIEDYLNHILEAATRIAEYIGPVPTREEFEKNPLVQDAVIRNLEIVGEAATNIQRHSPKLVKAYPQLPWSEMKAMRNKVIHGYFDVDLSVVWGTVREDVPRLAQQIKILIGELRGEV